MIYTSLTNLHLKVKTKSYKALGDNFIEWIESTTIKLYKQRNDHENNAAMYLKKIGVKFESQCVFFDSVTKKTYFLDFYLIERKTAIEIDGSSHKSKIQSDKERDRFFKSIGIKTIRIKNEEVTYMNIVKSLGLNKCSKKDTQQKEYNHICDLINKYNLKYKTILTINKS